MPRAFFSLRRLARHAGHALLLAGLFIAWLMLAQRGEADRPILDAQGQRVSVTDGDTLRIGVRAVRLAGIDAVELRQWCTAANGRAWRCGRDARTALAALVRGGGLICAGHGQDRYGRTIATCRTAATADLGAAMVEAGWAINWKGRDKGRYALEEARAALARRGIWSGRFQEPRLWRAAHHRSKPAS